jgi:hypothetical protein
MSNKDSEISNEGSSMVANASPADSSKDDESFLLAEYKEAAAAYFKGVDVGITSLKQFIATSSALLALVHSKIVPTTFIFNLKNGAEFLITLVGIVICFIFIAILKRYFLHLENCRSRCEELEKIFGGQFFTRLGDISMDRNKGINTSITLKFIVAAFVLCWVFTLINLFYSALRSL